MQSVLQDASPYPAIPRQRPKPLGSLMRQLAKNDLKLIWRDRFLVFMVTFIVRHTAYRIRDTGGNRKLDRCRQHPPL